MQQQQPMIQEPQPQFTFEGGHLVMFHQEQTGQTPQRDATVNDRDRLMDLLAQEKYLSAGYNISLLEASHEELFQVLKQNQDACHRLQRDLYNLAFKKGWYRLPVAEAQSLFTAYNQVQQHKSELPFPTAQQQGTAAAGTTGRQRQEDQQLHQKVQTALQQAGQGQFPTGEAVYGNRRPH